MTPPRAFKGNKAALPSKLCAVCGRPMSWRRAWAKNWAEVRYCSEACRRRKGGRAGQAGQDGQADVGGVGGDGGDDSA